MFMKREPTITNFGKRLAALRKEKGLTLAQLGEKERAVGLLRESFAEGQPYWLTPHRELDLEPLWDEPDFREVIRLKG